MNQQQEAPDLTQQVRAFASLSANRCESLEDYLYLPSNLTVNRKQEIIRKFGDDAFRVDKDVSALRFGVLKVCEV